MDFPGKKIIPRFFVVAVLFLLVGLAVLVKAVYIMTAQKDYWMEVDARFQRQGVPVPPTRGEILSDNGEVLAASIPEYKLRMDFMSGETDSARLVKDQARRDSLLDLYMDTICNGLHEIFPDIDPAEEAKHLREGRAKKKKNWPILHKNPQRRVSYIDYRRVKALPLFDLPPYRGGFHVETFETRKNPYGKLAARTIGDLYGGIDSARSGLELGLDSILRGKPGLSHRQKVLNKYLTIIDQPATDGLDVQTTINIEMQDICEQALREQLINVEETSGGVEFGVCILMEVKTGDVKAITSLSKMKDGSFHEIQNRAVSNLMEPGSVFKPMSFLVAFNDGFLHMDDKVNTGGGIVEMHGRKMRDHNWSAGGYGTLTARQCIQKSSNIGVSTFIDRFYGKNPQKFVDGIKATGVADDFHLPLPGYATARIKSPKDPTWAKTDLPWMSIGYVTQIPPISTLAFYNGIANGGRMMRPRFVKAYLRDGQAVQSFDPVVVREHMASASAVENVKTCLREVVTLGVGKRAGSKMVEVAGKTGTAQVWSAAGKTSAYLVSFAGFFPYENPEYSCIVCINKTGAASGGGQCGPVFKRVAEMIMSQRRLTDYRTVSDSTGVALPKVSAGNMEAAQSVLSFLRINYKDETGREGGTVWGKSRIGKQSLEFVGMEQNLSEVPDVRDFGLRDAVYCLEKRGLVVKTRGVGRVVSQSLPPGTKFEPGQEIVLTLAHSARLDVLPDSVDVSDVEKAKPKAEETKPKPAPAADKPKSKPKEQPKPVEKPKKKEVAVEPKKQPAAKPKNEAKKSTKTAVSSKKTATKKPR